MTTFLEAKSLVRPLGMTLREDPHGDYRVNFRAGREGTAYYTPDLQDAIDTAHAMAAQRDGRAA